jgi:pimeloyl-ACP methyl ester carboxylesterase
MTDTSWIFLRGLAREESHWDNFTPFFENYFQTKVHCIDFPGVGKFFKQTSPSTIQEISDHLVMHSSHITEQSWILAHSMGCLVAMEWMQKEPHRFRGAVFINTSVGGVSPLFGRLKPFGIKQFFNLWIRRNNPIKREEIKYSITSNDPLKKITTISRWVEIQKMRPVSFLTVWNQIVAATFYKASKPRHPILLLNSSGDRLVSPKASEAIAKEWDLPIRTHTWAGHDIMHDNPQWVVDMINDWLPKK